MAIKISTLRAAVARSGRVVIAKSLQEAVAKHEQTAFLCHSHKDQEIVRGLQVVLKENGWNIYVDWLDNDLPSSPDKETAEKIKSKIKQTDWFLFLATSHSMVSRWCPWEIGYADAVKNYDRILIIPTEDESGTWHGNEYLQLYKQITNASDSVSGKSGYAAFQPKAKENGIWIENL